MDQQNIDRLFREKLDDFEITPSPKSWNEVEKQIDSKNKPALYWIAASIGLFLVSWLVWPEEKSNVTGIASQAIDHPGQIQLSQPVIPVAIELKSAETKVPVKQKDKTSNIQLAATEVVKQEDKQKNEEVILPAIEEKTAVAVAEVDKLPIKTIENLQEVTDTIKPEISAVKITYIASTNTAGGTRQLKNDSTGVLKKFIAFTEKLEPGEMLADIKTAKDNLLNGGLKNKKDRSVMTP